MTLVFDLDDTLYSEITFVKSGFKEVSNLLYQKHGIPQNESYTDMQKLLRKVGRGTIFDVLLRKNKLLNKTNLNACISVYRLHKPKIKLYKSAKRCLSNFKNTPKYIVTDGNKIVQRNKVKALNLDRIMKRIFITHQYGIKHAKPSTFCFEKILYTQKESYKNIYYIGDNPHKDFINIKKIGYKTIRVLTGNYKNLTLDSKYEADMVIKSLDQLNSVITVN